MFKCQKCGNTTQPREGATRLVVEVRKKEYFERIKTTDEEGNNIIVNGKKQGEGFETVREILACSNCSKGVNNG